MQRSYSRLKPSLPLPPLLLLLSALLAAGPALAQSGQSGQSPQNPTPPANAQRIEPGSDVPTTNIPPKRGTQIVEHRDGGQVTEVEVTAGGSHYYMKPNNQPGNAQTNSIRAPQWKVGEFDLSGKRRAANDAGQNTPTTADAPPPPPMPASPAPDRK